MRTLLKWLLRVLIALVLAAVVVGIWKRQEIRNLLAFNSLFSEEKIVHNFSHMNQISPIADLPRGDGAVWELPYGSGFDLPEGTDQWIEDRSVTSLLVMHNGEIRFEEYYLGTSADDRRISWSVAKSYLSSLFGILLDEGEIESLDDPVVKYAPELAGTAYEPATIRNVLNMASGVVFDEDYFDFYSDINRMGRVLAMGGTLDGFAASIKDTFAPAGETWQYVSIDTHVLSMVIRGATDRNIPDLMSDKILRHLGLEQDGYYITDGQDVAFVLGGMNFTTRDFARFGQVVLQDGQRDGQQLIPADWLAEATQPSAPTEPGKIGYGYQWWIPVGAHEGEFLARGVYGQYMYFDQSRGVLIVSTGADRRFREAGVADGVIEMFRKIAQSL